ncbi:uncharacterized protein LOC141908354 isoform X2 [Tubulanus polymorphus]
MQLERQTAELQSQLQGTEVRYKERFSRMAEIEQDLHKKSTLVMELERTLHERDRQVQTNAARLTEFEQLMRERNGRIAGLESEIAVKRQLEMKVTELEGKIRNTELRFEDKNTRLEKIESVLQERDREILEVNRELANRTNQMKMMESELNGKVTEISRHVNRVKDAEKQLGDRHEQLQGMQRELDAKSSAIIEHEMTISKLKEGQNAQIRELEMRLRSYENQMDEMNSRNELFQKNVDDLRQELGSKEMVILENASKFESSKREMEDKNRKGEKMLMDIEMEHKFATERINKMESELTVCREEIQSYITRLESERAKFNQEMLSKNEELATTDSNLRAAQRELENRNLQYTELERAMHERLEMLTSSTTRIHELEEANSQYQHKISYIEQQLVRKDDEFQIEMRHLEAKIESTVFDLEARHTQIQQLTKTIKELEEERQKLSDEIQEMHGEMQVQHNEHQGRATHIQNLESQIKHIELQRDQKDERVHFLEDRLSKLEMELHDQLQGSNRWELDIKTLQSDLQAKESHLKEVTSILDKTRGDLYQKDSQAAELSQSVKRQEAELRHRSNEVEHLERTLQERTNELKERVKQVSEIEGLIQENKKETVGKIRTLELSVSEKTHILEEKNRQVQILEEEVNRLITALKERDAQLQKIESTMKSRIYDLEMKANQSSEFEKQTVQQKNYIEDLRENNRLLNEDVVKLRGKMSELQKFQHEKERLNRQLEEYVSLLKSKDGDNARLAEELGAARAREAQVESHWVAENRNLQAELNGARMSRTEVQGEARSQVLELEEKVARLHRDLQIAHDELQSMNRQLSSNKEVLDAANEAIMIKETEIARLEAKIDSRTRIEQRELVQSVQYVPASLTAIPVDSTPIHPCPVHKQSSTTTTHIVSGYNSPRPRAISVASLMNSRQTSPVISRAASFQNLYFDTSRSVSPMGRRSQSVSRSQSPVRFRRFSERSMTTEDIVGEGTRFSFNNKYKSHAHYPGKTDCPTPTSNSFSKSSPKKFVCPDPDCAVCRSMRKNKLQIEEEQEFYRLNQSI